MKKKQVQQRVLQKGKPLALDKFEWDKKARVFSTTENNLVIDFSDIDGVAFKTDWGCSFKTGSYCSFDTGSYCSFDTGSYCSFITSWSCSFKTGSSCSFITSSDCSFVSEENCVVVRRDVYEIIEIPKNTKIKLNRYGIKGYTVEEKIEENEDIKSELKNKLLKLIEEL